MPNLLKRKLMHSFALIAMISLFGGACRSSQAQNESELQSAPPDVTIFAVPTSQTTARISVAYQKEVTKEQVKQDISRLALKGWTVSPRIELQNKSMRPEDIAHYPSTTSAAFTVSDAPQFVNGAPDILTYARAFQQWNHIATLFSVESGKASPNLQKFDDDKITVERILEENLEHYEILIKDHTGNLPAIVFVNGDNGKQATVAESKPNRPKPNGLLQLAPYLLLIVGAGILTGAGTYLVFSRWFKKPVN